MSATEWNTNIYGQAALEDRSAPRKRINIPASLRPSGESSFRTVLLDLALGGFCATAGQWMQPGNRCWLTLDGMDAMEAEVTWWDAGRVGCAFYKLLSPSAHDNILTRYRGTGLMRGD